MKILTILGLIGLLLVSTCKQQTKTIEEDVKVAQEVPASKATSQPAKKTATKPAKQSASTQPTKNGEEPYYAEGSDKRPGNEIFAEQIAKAKAEREKAANESVIKVEGDKIKFSSPSKAKRLVYMEKTPCFGTCKNYKLSVYQDGTTIFEGIRFIVRLGHYKTQVSPETLKSIQEKLKSLDYFNLSDEYPNDGTKIMDLPTVITSAQMDGKTKTIKNKLKAPQELIEFQKFLENILLTHTWQPIEVLND